MRQNIKKIFIISVYIFALIGFFLTAGYFAVKWGLTNTSGIIDTQQEEFVEGAKASTLFYPNANWTENEEWETFEEAVRKDEITIKNVSKTTSIEPRLIVSILAVEQLRLFYSERQVFKEIFSPLKILGVQNQFSWGIMGIKQETAKEIENNLKNRASAYYLGQDYETLLDFKTDDMGKERFERMTNEKNRYYSYLYGAILIKELIQGWKKAGVDISNSPGVVATLYNIGFANSKPHENPMIGGAEIDIGDISYTFGSLAHDIYYGEELLDVFPNN